ncbi:phosphate:acyl-[acyl carrier protein] acyltransferase [Ferrithrix thermotolerans DSM 19514]|uniref:Phosphate acyltransferase n=1 Tax=Ferrithrix thermotolerans DSM 19514 TaxID=1121881 RepID=A0A1M4VY84_9ACTN|nr:phosphate acyltransferase PlsX [Ferrithrix thermotolerans]SHE73909.1 phosphate:acyl-[acyl carrier protein] acyltransferase [Ferrithrix thermotolerans DSM 19514]
MKPIAVDLMGGDHAPAAIAEGLERVSKESHIPILAVGTSEAVSMVDGLDNVTVLEAAEVVEMDEDAAYAVRRKKDSSIVRCAEAVRDGRASALFSAGNTGAAMASSLFKMGRISKVSRPAIATTIPRPGHFAPTILLDSGANADCTPEWLVQFAVMGSIYSGLRFQIENPRVAVLSIGEEAGKGNSLVKETYELLSKEGRINFIGNCEGRDIMAGDVDVVVTDGFTGNVVLKTLEGGMRAFAKAALGALSPTDDADDLLTKAMPRLTPLITELSADTYGGAALLGVDGLCLIGHGSSGAEAIFNAIVEADKIAQLGLIEAIRTALSGS